MKKCLICVCCVFLLNGCTGLFDPMYAEKIATLDTAHDNYITKKVKIHDGVNNGANELLFVLRDGRCERKLDGRIKITIKKPNGFVIFSDEARFEEIIWPESGNIPDGLKCRPIGHFRSNNEGNGGFSYHVEKTEPLEFIIESTKSKVPFEMDIWNTRNTRYNPYELLRGVNTY